MTIAQPPVHRIWVGHEPRVAHASADNHLPPDGRCPDGPPHHGRQPAEPPNHARHVPRRPPPRHALGVPLRQRRLGLLPREAHLAQQRRRTVVVRRRQRQHHVLGPHVGMLMPLRLAGRHIEHVQRRGRQPRRLLMVVRPFGAASSSRASTVAAAGLPVPAATSPRTRRLSMRPTAGARPPPRCTRAPPRRRPPLRSPDASAGENRFHMASPRGTGFQPVAVCARRSAVLPRHSKRVAIFRSNAAEAKMRHHAIDHAPSMCPGAVWPCRSRFALWTSVSSGC